MKFFEEECPKNKIAIIWRRILSYLDWFDSLNAINIKMTYIHTWILHFVVDDKLKDSFDIDGDTGPCLLNRQFVGAYMLDSNLKIFIGYSVFSKPFYVREWKGSLYFILNCIYNEGATYFTGDYRRNEIISTIMYTYLWTSKS